MLETLHDVLVGVEYAAQHLQPVYFALVQQLLGHGQQRALQHLHVVPVDHGDA